MQISIVLCICRSECKIFKLQLKDFKKHSIEVAYFHKTASFLFINFKIVYIYYTKKVYIYYTKKSKV